MGYAIHVDNNPNLINRGQKGLFLQASYRLLLKTSHPVNVFNLIEAEPVRGNHYLIVNFARLRLWLYKSTIKYIINFQPNDLHQFEGILSHSDCISIIAVDRYNQKLDEFTFNDYPALYIEQA